MINADSMQVYRDLRILTARPTPAEEARVPHRLYGHVPAMTAYSVGGWLDDVKVALADCEARGLVPIVAGGTGLYFSALLIGLSPIPDIPDRIRASLRDRMAGAPPEALFDELRDRDPAMAARLEPGDRQRILRALEVVEATGRSLADWQKVPPVPVLPAEGVERIVLAPERDSLRQRIADRFQAMLQADVLDEVRAFMALDVPEDRPAARAHGVRPLAAYLRGEISLDEAAGRTVTETRQYAKRQGTWFRNQFPDWRRVVPS